MANERGPSNISESINNKPINKTEGKEYKGIPDSIKNKLPPDKINKILAEIEQLKMLDNGIKKDTSFTKKQLIEYGKKQGLSQNEIDQIIDSFHFEKDTDTLLDEAFDPNYYNINDTYSPLTGHTYPISYGREELHKLYQDPQQRSK